MEEKEFKSLSEKRESTGKHFIYKQPDIKEFIKRLKEEDNKIMCDLLRGKITIGEAQARLLQSRDKLAGSKLL